MGPDNVGLAIFVLLLSAAHLVSAQSETAILDMYVDCIEFEKLCGQLKPCENGAKCSPTYNDDGYKCDCPLGYGGKNCETKQMDLEVGKPKAREVDLVIRKLYKADWIFYITELLNLRTLRHALESRWDAEPGPVTKITLPSSQLEPGTPYRVRVRPAENLKEAPIWIDEATFKTPVELKVPTIKDSRAELSVIASNSSKWSNYSIQLTNSYKTITLNFSRAVNPENDTTVSLSPLDPETVYVVRVTPVQDEGEELPEWANEVSFKTRDVCIRDIALLLENSGRISPDDFQSLKAFAVSLIYAFDVKANGSHMAIISYSDYPRLEAGFDTFTGAELDNGSLILTVDNMRQMRGWTFFDRALNFTNEEVFQEKNGMRDEVKKVAVLVTAGNQTRHAGLENDTLRNVSRRLRDRGVEVMAIGVGNINNLNLVPQLLDITGRGDLVLLEPNFKSLRRTTDIIFQIVCPAPAK